MGRPSKIAMAEFVVELFKKLGPLGRLFPYEKPTFIQFVKFAMVGAVSSLILLVLLYSFTEFVGIYYLHAAALSLFISAINGYTLNHKWTFKTKGVRKHHFAFSRYLVLNICTYSLNLIVLATLVESFGVWYILAEIVAIFVALGGNFFGSKYWAFK